VSDSVKKSEKSVQLRIERIRNGFLFRPGGMPIYCASVEDLIVEVNKWVRAQAKPGQVLAERIGDFR